MIRPRGKRSAWLVWAAGLLAIGSIIAFAYVLVVGHT